MARPLKTLQVDQIRKLANKRLALRSAFATPDFRRGVAAFLETLLHESRQYAGFNFLDWLEGGHDRWVADRKPLDRTPYIGDESRRVYYAKASPTTVNADTNDRDYHCARSLENSYAGLD